MLGSPVSRDSTSADSFSTNAGAHSALHAAHHFSSSPTHSTGAYSARSHISRPVSSHTSTMDSHPTQDGLSFSDGADGASCEYDPEAWFQQFHDGDDADGESHPLPTGEQLEKAANIPVYDADGVSRPFKSLYTGNEHIGQRQLIIFIRHFYCFGCQTYLQRLTETITPSAYFSLPVPTTITVIGCGMPHLIPRYTTNTTCPFRIYADPTRKLYKALGMHMTVQYGSRPSYMSQNSAWEMTVKSLMPAVRAKRRDKLAAGNLMQVGGEFLFEDGEPAWCRRMQTYRDHTEMKIIRRVLEMDEEVPVVQEATAVALPARTSSHMGGSSHAHSASRVHVGSNSSSPISSRTQTSPVAAKPGAGLKLVWDGNGVSASLQRESRIPDEREELEQLSQVHSYYSPSEFESSR